MGKVREVLNEILEAFKTGNIPQAIAYSLNPTTRTPSQKWSLLNRLIMFIHATGDARGIRQWNEVGRKVKKGAKAIFILAPLLKKKVDEEQTEHFFLIGFKAVPVFRAEDTEGAALDYEKLAVPEFSFMDRAREWGLSVKAVGANNSYYGYYSKGASEIGLASPDEIVFFHELAHAAHSRISEKWKGGQDWKQEVVADLAAQALFHLAGKQSGDYLGNTYEYIEHYATRAKPPLTPITACLQVLSETEQVLHLILNGITKEEEECSFENLYKGGHYCPVNFVR